MAYLAAFRESGLSVGALTERRNIGTTETQTEGTRTRADTSGTGADTASCVKAPERLERHSRSLRCLKGRSGRFYRRPERPLFQNEFPAGKRSDRGVTAIPHAGNAEMNTRGLTQSLTGLTRRRRKFISSQFEHARTSPRSLFEDEFPVQRDSLVDSPDPSASVPEVSASVRVPSFDFQ
jgi:hypothetical protein